MIRITAMARDMALSCCVALALVGLLAAPLPAKARAVSGEGPGWPSLYYHVFVRSFADSNGDRIGDLPGLAARLDYLASLHVTHILVTPVQASPFYHNYFATDFDAVDPAYGGEAGWLGFVRASHARHMKVILDEEFQYVAEGHSWWRDNLGRPGRPEGAFLLWNHPDRQTDPEPFLNAPKYRTHDGRMVGIAMVDLGRDDVRRWFTEMLRRRIDPHGDGSLADGVDGFRIDHMMDDLDSKHRLVDLFGKFWRPLIASLKTVNPNLEFIAEQSDWGDGRDYLARGGVDAVFNFPLRAAIARLDKAALEQALNLSAKATPRAKRQLTFIENHDVDRFASVAGPDARKLRIGAVLDLTLGTDPILYYGQELGMRGRELKGLGSDGAQIPMREAFRWRADLDASGSATWYRSDDPWWTDRANRSGDGVSVEEEETDSRSLLTYYRTLTALRARRPELSRGRYLSGCPARPNVFCFTRRLGRRWTFVAINLSDHPAVAPAPRRAGAFDLMSGVQITRRRLFLPPWSVALVGSR